MLFGQRPQFRQCYAHWYLQASQPFIQLLSHQYLSKGHLFGVASFSDLREALLRQ